MVEGKEGKENDPINHPKIDNTITLDQKGLTL